jgi:PAS domain S-box-containing protein
MKYKPGVRATLVLLVLILTMPILALVVQTSITEKERTIEQAKVQLQVQAQLRADSQKQLFEGVRHMLKVISHAAPMQRPDTKECNRYLRELHEFFPEYAHLSFADPGGILVCRSSSTAGPFHIGDRTYFKGAVSTGNFTVGEYLVSRVTGRPSIALSLPVYRAGGELHGVLYAVRELASIQAQLDTSPPPPGMTDLITDAEGVVLASSGARPQPVGERLADPYLWKAVRSRSPLLDKALDENGQEWFHAIRPANVEGAGGLVVASIMSSNSVLRPATQRLQKEVAILLGIALAAILLAWNLGDRVLAEPIQRILAKVKALERGAAATVQPSPTAGPQLRELSQIDRGIADLTEALATRSLQRDLAIAAIQSQKLEIEASERRYRAQFEASPQPMWVFDTQTLAFLVVNDAAVTHYGYSRKEFMTMTLPDIHPPSTPSQLMNSVQQPDYGPANGALQRHWRKNGEMIDVEIAAHCLSWGGHPARVMIVYDVTSREFAKLAWKKLHATLERKVAERTRELELANEELEAFSYSVSHDLRGPLQVIDEFCGLLVERHGDELPSKARHYLDRIRAGTRQMNALIDDLLTLARTGRASVELQQVDLARIARATVAQLRQRFPQRQVSVEIEEPLMARCDPGLMAVLLDNLIGNAWKFTSATPQATIRVGLAAATQDGPGFVVADNGAGFDMAFADKLFKAFQRLHSASEFEGTGIGLAIVQRIIHRHCGRVWAESAVGKGASFFFSLPDARPGSI